MLGRVTEVGKPLRACGLGVYEGVRGGPEDDVVARYGEEGTEDSAEEPEVGTSRAASLLLRSVRVAQIVVCHGPTLHALHLHRHIAAGEEEEGARRRSERGAQEKCTAERRA